MCQTNAYFGTYKDMLSKSHSEAAAAVAAVDVGKRGNGNAATLSYECLFRYTCHMSAYLGKCEDMLLKRQSEAAAAAVDGGIGNGATLRGGSTKCAV